MRRRWWGPGTAVVAALLAGVLPGVAAADPTTATPPTSQSPAGTQQQCAPPATSVISPVPWAQQRLAPQQAWELSRGAGVTVAVIDSGVDGSDPQLAGHVLPGLDVIDGGGVGDTDCLGHGTFVASIIAAQPTPGIGFAGIAPGVRILPIRQTTNGQDGTLSGMATSIRSAVDQGAKVINISASSQVSNQALQDAVDYAKAHDVLIVAAADNAAKQGDPQTFPASYPGVVAVGAIGEDGKRADFSETGAFVDLAAPGKDVVGLGVNGPGQLIGQGTSFATPFVAGVAALVRAYRPNLTAAQVKHRLEATADHPATTLPDPQVGFGVVNPYAALATNLPEEGSAATAVTPSRHAPLVEGQAPAADHSTQQQGLLIGGVGLLALLLVPLTAFVVVRGRQRGWRPARAHSTEARS